MTKKLSALLLASSAVAVFAQECHVPDYAGKVYFRDAVDALQCQYRKNGRQVTLLPVGKNKPVMNLSTFEKYRALPLYDFLESVSAESPYHFDVEKMSDGGNSGYTIFALSYEKIPTVAPVDQMSLEAKAAYLAQQEKASADANATKGKEGSAAIEDSVLAVGKGEAGSGKEASGTAMADANSTAAASDANATAVPDVYGIDDLVDELAAIRAKIKDINVSGFDTDFIDWDINRIIEGIEQFRREKALSEG